MGAVDLTDCLPLKELGPLESSLLYVFVVGPGKGEGLALALPERGWVLVDSCTTSEQESNLVTLVQTYRRPPTDPVYSLVWTHPHEDHCSGLPDVLELLDPETVAVAGPQQAETALAVEAQCWRDMFPPTERERQFQASVRNALVAVATWRETHPEGLRALCDGATLDIPEPVTASVRAPTPTYLQKFYSDPECYSLTRRHANSLSLVLDVSFGETRIVLGGDLENDEVEGWGAVLQRHSHLGSHRGLKLPHHGSLGSFHDGLMTPCQGGQRVWWVTPFNSSRLPRPQPDEGLEILLRQESSVHLTALPASKKVQAEHPEPARVTRTELLERTNAASSGSWFIDGGTDRKPEQALGPLDPVWCCAFDSQNRLQGRWRGKAALEVVSGA